jgi:hypothetical protein
MQQLFINYVLKFSKQNIMKNKFIHFTFFLSILIAGKCFSQNFSIQTFSNLNTQFSQVVNESGLFPRTTSVSRICPSILLNYNLNSRISLESGYDYIITGHRYAISEDGKINTNIPLTYKYMQIPLLFDFKVYEKKDFSVHVETGFSFVFSLLRKLYFIDTSETIKYGGKLLYLDSLVYYVDYVINPHLSKTYSFVLTNCVTLRYNLSKNWGIVYQLRLNTGFIPFLASDYYSRYTENHYGPPYYIDNGQIISTGTSVMNLIGFSYTFLKHDNN